ncbi:MAG TPA: glycosyltransferase family 4 protein [Candidatus Didemnitutus sp.]|nr:glycosyltransferase family 4 protein [Candidatus Didemnitutus sp.]
MRITIVNGFFLPVPPVAGGATEKSWVRLARLFAAQGHRVVSISRRWPGQPDDETADGIRHLRLPGAGHHPKLWRNLVRDFRWSLRVYRQLPDADIVVCNALSLPVWLGTRKPSAGKVVVMCGRVPKGQYRRYRNIARVLAPSTIVRDWVLSENPRLADAVRVTGYPIDWTSLCSGTRAAAPETVTLGYVGRLHEEKGLSVLAAAIHRLASRTELPRWRLLLCGPVDVARGGSGSRWAADLRQRLEATIGTDRLEILPAAFDDTALADIYRGIDVFCYPSLAVRGETFGVAVAEAMAAGAAPVVSDLACFRDFVHPEKNGIVFEHSGPKAAERLADALARLVADAALRRSLAAAAQAEVARYDFPAYADRLLEDFAQLTRS